MINFVRIMLLANAAWLAFGGAAWNTGNTFDAALYVAGLPLFFNWHTRVVTDHPLNPKAGIMYDVLCRFEKKFNWYWCILGCVGLVLMLPHFGGTAWIILIAQAFALAVYKSAWSWLMLPLTSLAALLSWPHWKPLVVEHQTRILGWATYLDHWWSLTSPWIGFGSDTFRFRAPKLAVNGMYFTWAHNDFVEVLFETGFVGLSFSCFIIWFLYRAARNDARLLSALFGFCACMMFYSPLQVVTGQLLALAIALEILKPKFKGFTYGM